MSENTKERLRAMSTEQLEQLMRLDLQSDGDELDDDTRAALVEVWSERVSDDPEYKVDIEGMTDEFRRDILPAAKPRRRRGWRPVVRAASLVIAAGLLTTAVISAVANAATVNPWRREVSWSDKMFKFGDEQDVVRAERHPISNIHTRDAYGCIASHNLGEPMLPSWYPEGYSYAGTVETTTENGLAFDITYRSDAGDEITVRVEWSPDMPDISTDGALYMSHGTEHYITTSDGVTGFAWKIGDETSVVRGRFTESDARRMIESVYEFDPEQPNYYVDDTPRAVQYREFDSVDDMLAELKITEPIVPTWLPDGMELGRISATPIDMRYSDKPNYLIGINWFGDDGRYVSLLIDHGEEPLGISYPKDESSEVEVVKMAGVEHYITQKDGHLLVVWRNGHNECALGVSANDRELIEPLLRSIYE